MYNLDYFDQLWYNLQYLSFEKTPFCKEIITIQSFSSEKYQSND